MNICLATREDLVQWWGRVPSTMRALVVKDGERVLGVVGLAVMPDHVQAFSSFKEELRAKPFVLARAAVLFKAMLEEASGPVLALCNQNEPAAPGLLTKLGFTAGPDGVWRHG